MTISTYLADVWSATEFGDPALSGYAESRLKQDTRVGVQTMALLALAMQIVVGLFVLSQDTGTSYLYTIAVLGVLSLHIFVSAFFVDDVKALHTLGMSFLALGALAITFLAHRAGDLKIGMMAAIVMLFIVIPLVPWALREAVAVVALTYALLTASLLSVPDRFPPGTFWVLQTLVLGAAVVVTIIAGRNTFIRKQDIRARFELENAKKSLAMLSMQDHLTGAWNRRYLDETFSQIAKDCASSGNALHIAVLDIDDFKCINDEFGHQAGDAVLKAVADAFSASLGRSGQLIRLGGDEFLIICVDGDLEAMIESAISTLQQSVARAGLVKNRKVSLSAGMASTMPGKVADLQALYRSADAALYARKKQLPVDAAVPEALVRTGTWQL